MPTVSNADQKTLSKQQQISFRKNQQMLTKVERYQTQRLANLSPKGQSKVRILESPYRGKQQAELI